MKARREGDGGFLLLHKGQRTDIFRLITSENEGYTVTVCVSQQSQHVLDLLAVPTQSEGGGEILVISTFPHPRRVVEKSPCCLLLWREVVLGVTEPTQETGWKK